MTITVIRLDHVQVAMPLGEEALARAFYGGLLGLPEIPKPSETVGRGGVWFACGDLQLHLGVEPDFRPAKKAHPAFIVLGYRELLDQLRSNGYEVIEDHTLPECQRAFTFDPFGNRVEIIAGDGLG